MYKRIALFVCALLPAMAVPAAAQARVEVSGFVGWAFSDGVSGNAVLAADGNIYDRIDPQDSVIDGFIGTNRSPWLSSFMVADERTHRCQPW